MWMQWKFPLGSAIWGQWRLNPPGIFHPDKNHNFILLHRCFCHNSLLSVLILCRKQKALSVNFCEMHNQIQFQETIQTGKNVPGRLAWMQFRWKNQHAKHFCHAPNIEWMTWSELRWEDCVLLSHFRHTFRACCLFFSRSFKLCRFHFICEWCQIIKMKQVSVFSRIVSQFGLFNGRFFFVYLNYSW